MKLLLKLWLLTAAIVLALGGIAYAQDGSIGEQQPGASQMLWVLLVGTVVPLIVAFVTRWDTASPIKVILMAFLSALGSALVVWQTWPTGAELSEFAFAAVLAIISSVAQYYGIYKPINVTSRTVGIGQEPKAA
jgi:hypothetical protein